ncbi:MAG: hypothetical protein HGB00_00810 [Chlorobiaceae bacterium]|nr:hypothetical protein [Chlorobiaceae bacterium]
MNEKELPEKAALFLCPFPASFWLPRFTAASGNAPNSGSSPFRFYPPCDTRVDFRLAV